MAVNPIIPIKAIIAIIKGLTIEEFANVPIYTGTSLHIFEVKDDRIDLLVEDDISHLEYDTSYLGSV